MANSLPISSLEDRNAKIKSAGLSNRPKPCLIRPEQNMLRSFFAG